MVSWMPLCLCGDSASTYCLGRSTLTHLAVSRSLESWPWGVGGKKNRDERIDHSRVWSVQKNLVSDVHR